MASASPAGWLFLEADRVPERWRERARPAAFIPLLDVELSDLLAGNLTEPQLSADDEQLAELIARGHSVRAIGRQIGVSTRTVERRLAGLRERLGVGSSVDLALALAQRGFSVAADPTSPVGGSVAACANASGHQDDGGDDV